MVKILLSSVVCACFPQKSFGGVCKLILVCRELRSLIVLCGFREVQWRLHNFFVMVLVYGKREIVRFFMSVFIMT